jgi:hypothetical protein
MLARLVHAQQRRSPRLGKRDEQVAAGAATADADADAARVRKATEHARCEIVARMVGR